LPAIPDWNEPEKLSREKSVLGFYVSGHPLLRYEMEMKAFATAQLGNPAGVKSGAIVRVGGIVSAVKKKVDRKGNMMAFVTLEDFSGKGELIVFSDAYRQFQNDLVEDAMVMVSGKAEQSGDSLRILANEVFPMGQVREKLTKSIVLSVRLDEMQPDAVGELRKVADRHKGSCSCYFDVIPSSDRQSMRLQATTVGVKLSADFIREIEKILGPNSVMISG
jgi:DNA polymerase-3 subunit alpha